MAPPAKYTLEVIKAVEGMATFRTDADGQNLFVVCNSTMEDGFVSQAYTPIAYGEAIVAYQKWARKVEAFVARKSQLDTPLSNTITVTE